MKLMLKKLVVIDPIELLLWTFRRNEKDVVNLYNALSDVMRLSTGGDMLNFGYWTEFLLPYHVVILQYTCHEFLH